MSAPLTVATFNVRYGTAPDGANSWRYRRASVLSLLKSMDFDACGLQEVLVDQREFLASELEGSRWYGVGRTDGGREGEQAPIVVRRQRLRVVGWTTLWLSDRPHVAGSRGWDAKIPRVATVLLGSVDGQPVGVVNTHLDHRGTLAQLSSARLIADLVRGRGTLGSPAPAGLAPGSPITRASGPARGSESRGGLSGIGGRIDALLRRGRRRAFGTALRRRRPAAASAGLVPAVGTRWIVMGDFNLGLDSPAMNELAKAGLRSVLPTDAGGTFHAWSGATDRQRIDHILVDDGWEVLAAEVRHDRPGGRLPSDHWPIVARLRLRAGQCAAPPFG